MADPLNTILYSLGGGLIPILIWLWFWLKEDRAKPEPARLIGRVFLAGALSVIIAYFFERALCDVDWFKTACLGLGGNVWLAQNFQMKVLILAWSAIEEILKFLAAYLVIFRQPAFDEPVDSMIYLITAALGFAALENAIFLFTTLTETGSGATFLLTSNLRFLGANLIHIIASAIVGGMLALAFCFRGAARCGYIVIGLGVAILLHALFNFLIIMDDGRQLFKVLVLLWLFALFIILFFEKVKTIRCLKISDHSLNG